GIDHAELHKHYRTARVFVHSSPDDRMSLTVGEALCSGCRVLSSIHDRGNEWFPGLQEIDPHDSAQVKRAIEHAWNSPDWDFRPNERARSMTWDRTAAHFIDVYRRCLNGK